MDKQIIKKFYEKDIAIFENQKLTTRLFLIFQQECQKIISVYEELFPVECARLSQLLELAESRIISYSTCIKLIKELVFSMYERFDRIYKYPKIFISHSTKDREFVEKFVTMLEQLGVKRAQLFCSSISGYGIPQNVGNIYDYIRNEISNNDLFVIMMLSGNYYESPACLNEMGASWIRQSKYQCILLPGFSFPNIKGAISPHEMCFSVMDTEHRNQAANELRDRIIEHLELDCIDLSLWERFKNKFFTEVDRLSVCSSDKVSFLSYQ